MAVNRYYSSNAVDTTLVNGVDASATEIVLQSTAGMPQSFPFTLALDYDTASEELVNVVGLGTVANSYKVGTTLNTASVTGRGVDGNAATSHTAGAPVKHVISARDIREAQVHIDASTKYTVTNGAVTYDVNLHGIADGEGSVVGTAKTQTLTNKTISGVSNTITDVPNTSVVGTAVTLAGTQTLTNKTLTDPKINDTIAVTASSTELNILDGATLSTAELNVLDGITASTTELNYVDGVTSAIQAQINAAMEAIVPKGTIAPFAGSTAPTNWLLCAGQAVSRTTYAGLFAVIGTTYGAGDGSTTFTLPDLRGRTIAGVDNMNGTDAGRLDWANTLGTAGGTQNHTLTIAEMPSHNHTQSAHSHVIEDSRTFYGENGATNWTFGDYPSGQRALQVQNPMNGTPTSSAQPAIQNTGGGGAHNNMQPTMLLNYIIKF